MTEERKDRECPCTRRRGREDLSRNKILKCRNAKRWKRARVSANETAKERGERKEERERENERERRKKQNEQERR